MSSSSSSDDDRRVALGEGARLIGVHPTTLRRWANDGLVPCTRTPRGQRRFRVGDLRAVLEGQAPPAQPPAGDVDAEPERAAAGAA